MNRNVLNLAGVLAAAMLAAGCGQGGGSAVAIPQTPDGTVEAVAQSLAKDQPRAVWDAMPAKWQKDVDALVDEFAGKMDAEVYNKTFAVVGKLAGTLKSKKSLILEALDSPQMQGLPVEKEQVAARYDSIVAFLDTIAGSDASTLSGLKSLDIGSFLGSTGARLMAEARKLSELAPPGEANQMLEQTQKLAGLTAEVVSTEGNTATVKITTGQETREEQMVKVDGKWVPKEMADEWDAKIAEARAGLAEMTGEAMQQNKAQVMGVLSSIEAGLDNVAKASDQQQLQAAMQGMMGAVMMQMMGGPRGPGGPGDMN